MTSNGEKLGNSPETLTAEQEQFLFGDQGPVGSSKDIAVIFNQKLDFAYSWLAQFWADDIPDELLNYRDKMVNLQKLIENDDETSAFRSVPLNPVALALRDEEFKGNIWHSMYERPVLGAALLNTYNALTEDPMREQKLNYVLNLLDEKDNEGWQNSGKGPWRDFVFPKPIEDFSKEPFPTHLADTELLF